MGKKLLFFNQKKDGNITDKEIKSISDKQAQKYLEKLPLNSLIDLEKIDIEGNQTFIRKGIFNARDGFIACIVKLFINHYMVLLKKYLVYLMQNYLSPKVYGL